MTRETSHISQAAVSLPAIPFLRPAVIQLPVLSKKNGLGYQFLPSCSYCYPCTLAQSLSISTFERMDINIRWDLCDQASSTSIYRASTKLHLPHGYSFTCQHPTRSSPEPVLSLMVTNFWLLPNQSTFSSTSSNCRSGLSTESPSSQSETCLWSHIRDLCLNQRSRIYTS